MMKEYQFAKKVEQMFAEEEQLRNPIAQGLPWTTDEPEVSVFGLCASPPIHFLLGLPIAPCLEHSGALKICF